MTYRNLNVQSDALSFADFRLQAVAEEEISSSFDSDEDIAQTTIRVLVSKSGEQIASIGYTADFWFAEGYDSCTDSWSDDAFRFELEECSIALAKHAWDSSETTAEEVDALTSGRESRFWSQAEKAAASLCKTLEATIREMREEDLKQ